MLGKKLKCYEDAGDDIVKYFGCLEGIDAQLREQQIYLQSKYIKIEVSHISFMPQIDGCQIG